ncbi:hypothetical protein MJO28_001005 [Puccinia striiformis f. sp. tritici]|uniref:Uncharacterized protein n=3 Tax=Puccinia striiformis TaxID=27350 RepID=A0A2S4W689_9BASI|nr:hypothetical protein MJO28_001005 [Puccinia striiformis f. sp. tritici]KAI7966977.1 hypothetical protein MJO29_000254 [Puccinia striiformis f. sp. tritici]POW17285.1 hypothetical protein PSTT_00696 [Puccinia striiformis]
MVYCWATEDRQRRKVHSEKMISDIHQDLVSVPMLPYPSQINYYNSRIVLCQHLSTIRSHNSFLLAQLPGDLDFLRAYHTATSSPLQLDHAVGSEGPPVPDKLIPVKRGMVLILMDNTGHAEYLEVNARVLLVAFSQSTLTVKPLTGSAKGLNISINRLAYRKPTTDGAQQGTFLTQFPVSGGFTVFVNEIYFDFPAIHISYSE